MKPIFNSFHFKIKLKNRFLSLSPQWQPKICLTLSINNWKNECSETSDSYFSTNVLWVCLNVWKTWIDQYFWYKVFFMSIYCYFLVLWRSHNLFVCFIVSECMYVFNDRYLPHTFKSHIKCLSLCMYVFRRVSCF